MKTMNEQQKETVRSLRLKGFAVVVFSPSELEGVNPETLQDRLIQLGNEAIEDLCEVDND